MINIKKYLVIIILFLLCGCSSKEQKLLEDDYYNYVNYANNCIDSDESVPFNVELTVEKLTEDYLVYRFYIDDPKENIDDIKGIITHDYETDDVFPTTGLYETSLKLYVNDINEKENKVKGIILIGYIDYHQKIDDFHSTFKGYIKYNSNQEYCFIKQY